MTDNPPARPAEKEAITTPSVLPATRAPLAPTPYSLLPTPYLDVHDVTVAYHRKPVLWDIDLTLNEPRLVGVVGPNGAGKSTLLKAILGLVPLASGEVRVLGQPVKEQRQRIGYVPQRESV